MAWKERWSIFLLKEDMFLRVEKRLKRNKNLMKRKKPLFLPKNRNSLMRNGRRNLKKKIQPKNPIISSTQSTA